MGTNGSTAANGDVNGADERAGKGGARTAEDVAKAVWSFFENAGAMVEEMMGVEDEVRLLRLRSRREEVVVVPGEFFRPAFLLRPWAVDGVCNGYRLSV